MKLLCLVRVNDVQTATEVINDPQTSDWLRWALRSALERDPIDVANDAELLRILLVRRVSDSFQNDGGDAGLPRQTSVRHNGD